MSTTASSTEPNTKFTRGEKCVFVHIVITFCLIIAIVIGYYAHACLVRHQGNLGVALGRRSASSSSLGEDASLHPEEFRCVGAVYVQAEGEERAACGAALLSPRWSLVPARCVTARSRPALAHLLPYWTLRYETNTTGIRRGIPHPNYDADDSTCDLALFEHETEFSEDTPFCSVPTKIIEGDMVSDLNDLYIVGWQFRGGRSVTRVQGLPSSKCAQFTTPVTEQADAICITANIDDDIDANSLLGGILFSNSQMIAISSWGNGIDGFPLVVVDIAPYKDWLGLTMTVSH